MMPLPRNRGSRIKLKSTYVGRRTGLMILAGKTIRKNEDGTDNFEDYWTENDSDSSTDNIVHPKHCELFTRDESLPKVSTLSNREPEEAIRESPKKKKRGQPKADERDPQKAQKRKKSKLQNEEGSRRSSRNRMAPLEFWRNERLNYRFTKSGNIQVLGVVPGSKPDLPVPYPKQNIKRSVAKRVKSKRETQAIPITTFVENGVPVIESETNEVVFADIIRPFKALTWRGSETAASDNKLTFDISKAFQFSDATYGFLRIYGMQKKPLQYLPNHDVIFTVIDGKVEIQIHDTVLILKKSDSYLVPSGNPYSVENLEHSEALLTFIAISQSFLPELKKD